jgi:hypothetical protein
MNDLPYDGRALLEEGLSPSEAAIFAIIKMADPCYVYWDDLAIMASLSESTVRRVTRSLAGKGLVERVQEKRTNLVGYARTLAGSPFPGRPGYVTGLCAHAVAGSEWRAGRRWCERCGH